MAELLPLLQCLEGHNILHLVKLSPIFVTFWSQPLQKIYVVMKGQNVPARPFLYCHFCTSKKFRDAPSLFSLESLSISTEIDSLGSSVPVLVGNHTFSHTALDKDCMSDVSLLVSH